MKALLALLLAATPAGAQQISTQPSGPALPVAPPGSAAIAPIQFTTAPLGGSSTQQLVPFDQRLAPFPFQQPGASFGPGSIPALPVAVSTLPALSTGSLIAPPGSGGGPPAGIPGTPGTTPPSDTPATTPPSPAPGTTMPGGSAWAPAPRSVAAGSAREQRDSAERVLDDERDARLKSISDEFGRRRDEMVASPQWSALDRKGRRRRLKALKNEFRTRERLILEDIELRRSSLSRGEDL